MWWTKQRARKYLLLSLIPTLPLGFVLFVVGVVVGVLNLNNPDPTAVEMALFLLMWGVWAWWWLALIAGIVLHILVSIEESSNFRKAQGYAELHGWHPISKTSWRNYKRHGIVLSVVKSTQSPVYLLNIDIDGEIVSTNGFDRALFALNFGDYLWRLMSGRVHVTVQDTETVMNQQRAQWEATNLPALRTT